MELWEFMKAYAESFWAQGDYAYEIFSVLMAWFVTIGVGLFFLFVLPAIGFCISFMINNWNDI